MKWNNSLEKKRSSPTFINRLLPEVTSFSKKNTAKGSLCFSYHFGFSFVISSQTVAVCPGGVYRRWLCNPSWMDILGARWPWCPHTLSPEAETRSFVFVPFAQGLSRASAQQVGPAELSSVVRSEEKRRKKWLPHIQLVLLSYVFKNRLPIWRPRASMWQFLAGHLQQSFTSPTGSIPSLFQTAFSRIFGFLKQCPSMLPRVAQNLG